MPVAATTRWPRWRRSPPSVGAEPEPRRRPTHPGRRSPAGELGAESIARAIGALLPEGAIVSDEANTSGTFLPAFTAGAPRHDWLTLTGGSIGQGLPVALGAAIACPDRPVLALEADGSALYTLQSLWTMAREQLNVTTVIFSNRRYAILRMELARVGATASGERALEMLDISPPEIDFVALAQRLWGSGDTSGDRGCVRRGPGASVCRAGSASHRGGDPLAVLISAAVARPPGSGSPASSRAAAADSSTAGRSCTRAGRRS